MKLRIAILISAAVLCGCDSGVEWRDREYEVSWLDTADNRSLYRSLDEGGGIGRVGAEVIAVGSDDRYIVAKQRSQSDGAVSYFIIDRKKDDVLLNADEITKGPFSAKDFDVLKGARRLPEFSATFGY